ncbi:dipeptide ABC transporter ATP-binding protein [Phyllobacterium myrsinacearum]|uniref:ABC-type microcin C transport system duplicated ATPase subunit YejF n=1 Tax=Phyllobacterium myrsinacearum TaxID=28101 RepID=A0A839ENM1_9HYPH|nr:ABC-type microcin C transport system duplicated ATPase subunit YejF [Phyllobacterium myrsinacearum]
MRATNTDRRQLLTCTGLTLRLPSSDPDVAAKAILNNVDFTINRGETLAVVGESGSGKSTLSLCLLGLLPKELVRFVDGEIRLNGADLIRLDEPSWRKLRGARISIIFQEPMTSLNPVMPIGKQIVEAIRVHRPMSKADAWSEALGLLRKVKISDPEVKMNAYPGQLSGGQRQRVMIAMALSNSPDILIADEPTTALDVTIQAEIITLLQQLRDETGMALLFITHDLTLVRSIADRVLVMQNGAVVEQGPTDEVMNDPKHDYTRYLIACRPTGSKEPVSPLNPELLGVKNLTVQYTQSSGFFSKRSKTTALSDLSLSVKSGQTIGIVGESGSGKSTLARAVLQLVSYEGQITFAGRPVNKTASPGLLAFRKQVQVVFQDPYGALSPRMTIGEFIAEPLRAHFPQLSQSDRKSRVAELLEEIGIGRTEMHRYPHSFSGGQRQRIAIARALVMNPQMLILDEPTSALDVSVQLQVLKLLRRLQEQHNLTYLLITHDLAVVSAMADEVLVLKDGKEIERGATWQVLNDPQQEYTRRLVSAAMIE